jgi:hypothetical protein
VDYWHVENKLNVGSGYALEINRKKWILSTKCGGD